MVLISPAEKFTTVSSKGGASRKLVFPSGTSYTIPSTATIFSVPDDRADFESYSIATTITQHKIYNAELYKETTSTGSVLNNCVVLYDEGLNAMPTVSSSLCVVKNITESAGTKVSVNTKNKVLDGIYSRNFTNAEVKSTLKDYEKEKKNPYEVSTKSNYYYMIRETGGIITGAYVDDRNIDILPNPYIKTNVGVESYLLELGYLTNKNDLNNIINKTDKYITGIIESIKSLYNNNYQL